MCLAPIMPKVCSKFGMILSVKFGPFCAQHSSFNFAAGHHLDTLRRRTSPTILTDLNQLNSIDSEDLLPDSIGDDGPSATAGQALAKWLNTPTKDGKPKQLSCSGSTSKITGWITNFKETFLHSNSSSASYIIRIKYFKSKQIGPFELVNERTNEKLTLAKESEDKWDRKWIMKRCKIGQTMAIQWENGKANNLNNVRFHLHYQFG